MTASLLLLFQASLAISPPRAPLGLQRLARPTQLPRAQSPVCVIEDERGLTGEVITYEGLPGETRMMVDEALAARDRARVMEGKPKYETVERMVDEYERLATEAGKDWSRAEAESEVVRYLCRRSLAVEGGLEGDGQDKAAFALLALLLSTVVYGGYLKLTESP